MFIKTKPHTVFLKTMRLDDKLFVFNWNQQTQKRWTKMKPGRTPRIPWIRHLELWVLGHEEFDQVNDLEFNSRGCSNWPSTHNWEITTTQYIWNTVTLAENFLSRLNKQGEKKTYVTLPGPEINANTFPKTVKVLPQEAEDRLLKTFGWTSAKVKAWSVFLDRDQSSIISPAC